MKGYVYIMSNKNNSVLYTGVTTDLRASVDQHKNRKHPDSFTSRYNICKLLWFETLDSISLAIKKGRNKSKPPRVAGLTMTRLLICFIFWYQHIYK